MDISLIHAGLAGGAALAALPVILHLFMKQTPKHVIFPALRLIRERQKRSRKKLRVKNWLLLLARMALVALMALALARPRLFSQTSLGDQEVPTAAGLVFDTSLSMGYMERDKTRLGEAKERALEIIKKLPDTSQVFVVDSAEPGVPAPFTPASARKRIEALTLHAANRPLNAAVGQAYTAVAACDQPRREVFVLTDLARSSWDTGRQVEGLEKARKAGAGKKAAARGGANAAEIATYVLRLSPKETHDVSIVEASPSVSVATQGEPVEIRAKIRARGPGMTRTAEFRLDGELRHKEQVTLPDNGEAEIKFVTPKLDPAVPLHQGSVRLSGKPDPLEFDDVRYLTFKVQPALKALVVSDFPIDAEFVADALDPTTLPEATPRTCRVESIRTPTLADRLREQKLKDYACVFLLDVKEIGPAEWGRLNTYVREGGGLIVGLGERCLPESYGVPAAAELLPATPKERKKGDSTFGKVHDLTHPLFRRYTRELDAQLAQVPVYKHWTVTPPQDARTLLSFADRDPALLERTFRGLKTGRVLLWTTPLSRRVDTKSPAAWNEFPLPDLGFSFFVLMNQTVTYLAGTTNEVLNFEAGQDVVLPIDPTRRFKNFIVEGSDKKAKDRLSPPTTSDSLVIVSQSLPATENYSVTASGADGAKTTLGFSVNAPASESEFVPLEEKDLDALFGKEGYKLAVDAESLDKNIKEIRVGREIFPVLMFLILVLVTVENLLANKFYREAAPRTAAMAA